MTADMAENLAGRNHDSVLVLVTERVSSLNKRFDKFEDKIEEWRKEDREFYLHFEKKLNEHDGKLNNHELKFGTVCGDIDTLKTNMSKWHHFDLNGFYQGIMENKGKIIIGFISLLTLIATAILT